MYGRICIPKKIRIPEKKVISMFKRSVTGNNMFFRILFHQVMQHIYSKFQIEHNCNISLIRVMQRTVCKAFDMFSKVIMLLK